MSRKIVVMLLILGRNVYAVLANFVDLFAFTFFWSRCRLLLFLLVSFLVGKDLEVIVLCTNGPSAKRELGELGFCKNQTWRSSVLPRLVPSDA